jgi:hypothetical protein
MITVLTFLNCIAARRGIKGAVDSLLGQVKFFQARHGFHV